MAGYLHDFRRISRFFLRATAAGVRWGCIIYCTTEFVGSIVICTGPSMEPTIISSDIVVTENMSLLGHKVSKGDIVIARSPTNPRQFICKRVIGVPGDQIRNSFFSRDIVPKGHVWLEGDNKNHSTDSRDYGPVPIALLKGKAVCKIWPVKDATIF